MSDFKQAAERLAEKTYRANKVHRSYPYNVDYWLIGKGKGYVDAKRMGSVMFLIVYIWLAYFTVNTFFEMEDFSYYLFSNIFENETRIESILRRTSHFWIKGYYYKFIFGIFLATYLLFLSIHLLFGPYPRPVRFNHNNGLVYTRWWGQVWVVDWDHAAIKIWRGKNMFLPWLANYRGICIRLHRIDRKGKVKERYVVLSALNSNRIDDLKIGGDPGLLYWHWLDEYMHGASFEGEAPAGSRKKCIPVPKIGRFWLLEKLMRFRPYKFPPKIDQQAIELDKKLKRKKGYPAFKGAKLPENPFFPWEYDFPERVIPNKGGIVDEAAIAEHEYRIQKALDYQESYRTPAQRAQELALIVKEQGVTKSYRDFTLVKLKEALSSDTQKTPEELELIKLYIELGGYDAQR